MKVKVISDYKKIVEDGLNYNLEQIQKPELPQVTLDSTKKAIEWQKDMIKRLNEQILELSQK